MWLLWLLPWWDFLGFFFRASQDLYQPFPIKKPFVAIFSEVIKFTYVFDCKGNYWELSDEIFSRIDDSHRQDYEISCR